MALSELRRLLEGDAWRRVSPDDEVWMLGEPGWWAVGPGRDLQPVKVAVLRTVWQLPLPVFFSNDEPEDPELAPFIQPQGSAWRVRTDADAADFYATDAVSSLGNWRLYAAPAPLTTGTLDTFRRPPAEVADFLRAQRVGALIDCFHDDTEWCIALDDDAFSAAAGSAPPTDDG